MSDLENDNQTNDSGLEQVDNNGGDTTTTMPTGFFESIANKMGMSTLTFFGIICIVCIICSIMSSLVYYFSSSNTSQEVPKQKTQFEITQGELNSSINSKLFANPSPQPMLALPKNTLFDNQMTTMSNKIFNMGT